MGAGFLGDLNRKRYNQRMELTEKQRRHLRGLAHPLKPVILIGNSGVSDGVVAETQRALHDHELIKVRLPGMAREDRDQALVDLAARTDSVLVGRIGHVATLYKPRSDLQRIVLPGR
jgi:RNA-binding protein